MSRVIKTVTADGAADSGSGLTETQVDARIAAKQPWTFLEQVDISSPTAAVILETNSDYSTFMILIDQGMGTTSSYFQARYLTTTSASSWISSGYGVNQYRGRSSSNAYQYNENTSQIQFGLDSTGHAKNIEFVFTTTKNGKRPVFRFHYGGGTSTYDPAFAIGGGQLNMSTSTDIAAMYIYPNTGNIASGSFKIYGLNDHD